MFFSENLFLCLMMMKFFLLGLNISRLLNFIIFSEMFMMNLIYFLSFISFYFEMSLASLVFILGAGETGVGFLVLMKNIRGFSLEIFRTSKLFKCEGF